MVRLGTVEPVKKRNSNQCGMVRHNHIVRVCFGAALIILRARECVRDREEMNALNAAKPL